MRPFWRSDTIFNETVLLLSEKGMPAYGLREHYVNSQVNLYNASIPFIPTIIWQEGMVRDC